MEKTNPKLAGIYRITLRRPGKLDAYYFGQSSWLAERQQQHLRALRAGRHDNSRLQRSFAKYGESSLAFSVVLVCQPVKDILLTYEQSILDFYRVSLGPRRILNVMQECVSTHLGVKRRPETIERMSLSQKGRKKSPEQIEKTAKKLRGIRHSPEACAAKSARMKEGPMTPKRVAALDAARDNPLRLERLREALVGRPKIHSPETIAKISKSLMGLKQTEESKRKKSVALRGRKISPESIAKRTASRRANRLLRMSNHVD